MKSQYEPNWKFINHQCRVCKKPIRLEYDSNCDPAMLDTLMKVTVCSRCFDTRETQLKAVRLMASGCGRLSIFNEQKQEFEKRNDPAATPPKQPNGSAFAMIQRGSALYLDFLMLKFGVNRTFVFDLAQKLTAFPEQMSEILKTCNYEYSARFRLSTSNEDQILATVPACPESFDPSDVSGDGQEDKNPF